MICNIIFIIWYLPLPACLLLAEKPLLIDATRFARFHAFDFSEHF